ncbi:unnamed protein product, partial [Mycena citricolor]
FLRTTSMSQDQPLVIPFSLDEYGPAQPLTEEFEFSKRLQFWDGPIRAFLSERGYTLNRFEIFGDKGSTFGFMYPALEFSPSAAPKDPRYAFVDTPTSFVSLTSKPFKYHIYGKVAFAQETSHPEKHIAVKLIRNDSPEYQIMKTLLEDADGRFIRGLVPVLDLFPFCGHWLAVTPRWGDDARAPWPSTIGQALDLLEDALSGLAYLHERRIVHRDISFSNMLTNHIPSQRFSDVSDAMRSRLRNQRVLTLGLFDYNLSLVFPRDTPLELARSSYEDYFLGAWKPHLDVGHGEYQYNPFAVDVLGVGYIIGRGFQHMTPVAPILAPVIDGLVHWHPPSRLTAAAALDLLRTLKAEYGPGIVNLAAPTFQSMGYDELPLLEEFDRWKGLPEEFIARWKHLRTPPVPFHRRLLHFLCSYEPVSIVVRQLRRLVDASCSRTYVSLSTDDICEPQL